VFTASLLDVQHKNVQHKKTLVAASPRLNRTFLAKNGKTNFRALKNPPCFCNCILLNLIQHHGFFNSIDLMSG